MNRFFTTALVNKRKALGEKEKGFTLIELLVVVLILGVLAAIAIPIYLGQQETAKDNAVAAAITNAKTAIVAELVTGTTLTALKTGFPKSVPAYTASADIEVSLTVTKATATLDETFTVTGFWSRDNADTKASAKNHGYTISGSGAALKM